MRKAMFDTWKLIEIYRNVPIFYNSESGRYIVSLMWFGRDGRVFSPFIETIRELLDNYIREYGQPVPQTEYVPVIHIPSKSIEEL